MGRNKLETINVVDIECTCWFGSPPEGEQSEIIEIGIAQLDLATLTVQVYPSLLIRPRLSKVGPFCEKITTITQEMVEGGIELADALRHLQNSFDSNRLPWASYGDYDRKMFEEQCRFWQLPYPFGSRHLNIKTLAGMAYDLPTEFGMDVMLEKMGLPLVGTHHRAGDDAANIAEILASLLRRTRSGETFPI